MKNEIPSIENLIPQRFPFVLVDQLIEHKEEYSKSSYLVNSNHILIENNKLSEYGLMENMAQTAAARAGMTAFEQSSKPQLGFIGAISKLNISNRPQIESEITTKVFEIAEFGPIKLVKCEVELQEEIIASCEMKIALNEE